MMTKPTNLKTLSRKFEEKNATLRVQFPKGVKYPIYTGGIVWVNVLAYVYYQSILYVVHETKDGYFATHYATGGSINSSNFRTGERYKDVAPYWGVEPDKSFSDSLERIVVLTDKNAENLAKAVVMFDIINSHLLNLTKLWAANSLK